MITRGICDAEGAAANSLLDLPTALADKPSDSEPLPNLTAAFADLARAVADSNPIDIYNAAVRASDACNRSPVADEALADATPTLVAVLRLAASPEFFAAAHVAARLLCKVPHAARATGAPKACIAVICSATAACAHLEDDRAPSETVSEMTIALLSLRAFASDSTPQSAAEYATALVAALDEVSRKNTPSRVNASEVIATALHSLLFARGGLTAAAEAGAARALVAAAVAHGARTAAIADDALDAMGNGGQGAVVVAARFPERLTGWRAAWDWRAPVRDIAAAPLDLPDDVEFAGPADAAAMRALLPDVVHFLAANYVEDAGGGFRFAYEARHLEWALLGAGSHPDLWIVLRARAAPHEIVGFAAAAPTTLVVRGVPHASAFVDFVCVHKAHRGRRLCPALYSALSRALVARGITAFTKTTGSLLDLPLARARYWHISINGERLKACGFSRTARVPSLPDASGARWRSLVMRDAAAAHALLASVAAKHSLGFAFTSAEHLAHVLLPQSDLVDTFVLDDNAGTLTDIVSLYFVRTRILGDNALRGEDFVTAYLYFFAATTVPVKELICVAARAARAAGADMFNALPISGLTARVMRELGAGAGTGELRYYASGVELGSAGLNPSDIFIFPGV
jgi:glycylpeptide N-tetradecanoyltransferase